MTEDLCDSDYVAAHGRTVLTRLKNRQGGGRSGRGGYDYEDFYSLYALALLAAAALNSRAPTEHRLVAGDRAIVDDLVITTPTSQTFVQLKTGPKWSWNIDGGSLKTDFQDQQAVSRKKGRKGDVVRIVVSDLPSHRRLLEGNRYGFDVVHFPEGAIPVGYENLGLPHDTDLANAVAVICAPFYDENTIVTTMGALSNAWTGASRKGTVIELLLRARRHCRQIRTASPELSLPDDMLPAFESTLFYLSSNRGRINLSLLSNDARGEFAVPFPASGIKWQKFIAVLSTEGLTAPQILHAMYTIARDNDATLETTYAQP